MMLLPSFAGEDIAYSRTAIFNSQVQSSPSLRSVSISYASYPVYEWTLQFNALRDYVTNKEALQLLAFFNILRGRGEEFLFKDPEMNQSTSTLIGVGTGAISVYRIGYLHSEPLSGQTFFEPVQEATGVSITKNGVGQTSPTNYTLSDAGLITFTSPVTAGHEVRYTGSHRYRCQMLEDKMSQDRVASQIWKAQIKFRSVKI